MTGSLITAWDVYWVMQLDAINMLACLIMVLFGIAGGLITAFGVDENVPLAKRVGKRLLFTAALAAMIVGFAPSSKTAAAMIILPALTSEEVVEPVSREFGEIYSLAKIGLANLVTEDAANPIKLQRRDELEETNNEDAE